MSLLHVYQAGYFKGTLEAIRDHLHVAKIQRDPSDDKIIADHIDQALAFALNALEVGKLPCFCKTCCRPVESLNEADQCEDCHEKWTQEQIAHLKPIYDGEVAAGLHNPNYREEMIAAGRGHLVQP